MNSTLIGRKPLLALWSLVALLIGATSCALGEPSLRAVSEVEPFRDELLPRNDLENQEQFGLMGRIKRLNTLLAEQDIFRITTKYNIYSAGSYKTFEFKLPKDWKTRKPLNATTKELFGFDPEMLEQSGFNPSRRTIVIIAGFLSKEHTDWMLKLKDDWRTIDSEANVILVSWESSNRYIYSRAVANTPFVARQISIVLYYLAGIHNLQLGDDAFAKKFHFFGHSLGAHISGFVGKDLGGKLGRITGMDPAGPSFDTMDPKMRLHRSDACLVDAIHTNMGKMHYLNAFSSGAVRIFDIFTSKVPYLRDFTKAVGDQYTGEGNTAWFGIEDNVGDIDYFANNGKTQPGCTGLMHVCDHARATDLVHEILKYEHFRHNMVQKNLSKTSRLLAFKSDSASDFASVSFVDYTRLNRTFFASGSLPIDMTTPVDELIAEFEQDYGVSFAKDDADDTPRPRYFFKTLDKEPYVADHYFLRLYLDSEPIWGNHCALHATIINDHANSTVVKLNKAFNVKDKDPEGTHYGIAMPFVHPMGHRARYHINRILEQLKQADPSAGINPSDEKWKKFLDEVARFAPLAVNLNVTKAEKTGIFELIDPRSWAKQTACELPVSYVWIEPVVPSDYTLIAVYAQKDDQQSSQIGLNEYSGFNHTDENFESKNLTLANETSWTVRILKLLLE